MDRLFPTSFSPCSLGEFQKADQDPEIFRGQWEEHHTHPVLACTCEEGDFPITRFSFVCDADSLSSHSGSPSLKALLLRFRHADDYEQLKKKLADQNIVMGGSCSPTDPSTFFQSSRALHIVCGLLKQELKLHPDLETHLSDLLGTLPHLEGDEEPLLPLHPTSSCPGFGPALFGRYSRDLSLQLDSFDNGLRDSLEMQYYSLKSQSDIFCWEASFSSYGDSPLCFLHFHDQGAKDRFCHLAEQEKISLPGLDPHNHDCTLRIEGVKAVSWALSFLLDNNGFFPNEKEEIHRFLRHIHPHMKTLKPPKNTL